MTTRKSVLAFIKKIELSKTRIAVERDKLRELVDDVVGIIDDADEAQNELERVVDILSKYL